MITMDKCITFEIWGELVIFENSIPHLHLLHMHFRQEQYGMIGAIINWTSKYLEHFQTPEVKCGVQIGSR